MNDKAISDCKDTIRQLETNIKKEEELNKQLADKNLAISKGNQNPFKSDESLLSRSLCHFIYICELQITNKLEILFQFFISLFS